MTKLRLVLLATTALTAMQFAGPASHAQTAPLVVAQAKDELGPDGKPKAPPKGAPPAPKPPARPTPPQPPPPAAAPPRPRLRCRTASAGSAAPRPAPPPLPPSAGPAQIRQAPPPRLPRHDLRGGTCAASRSAFGGASTAPPAAPIGAPPAPKTTGLANTAPPPQIRRRASPLRRQLRRRDEAVSTPPLDPRLQPHRRAPRRRLRTASGGTIARAISSDSPAAAPPSDPAAEAETRVRRHRRDRRSAGLRRAQRCAHRRRWAGRRSHRSRDRWSARAPPQSPRRFRPPPAAGPKLLPRSPGCRADRDRNASRFPQRAAGDPGGRPHRLHRARPHHHSRSERPVVRPPQRGRSLPLRRARHPDPQRRRRYPHHRDSSRRLADHHRRWRDGQTAAPHSRAIGAARSSSSTTAIAIRARSAASTSTCRRR